jgi:phosphate starvation-inducible PhoH-like protein
VILDPDEPQRLANVCGQFDEHLRQIERRLDIRINNRGNRFQLTGPEANTQVARRVLQDLFSLAASEDVDPERVHMAL